MRPVHQQQAGLVVGMCNTWHVEGPGVVIYRTWHIDQGWLGDVQNLAYGSGMGGARKEYWNHAHFKQPLLMHPSSQYAGGGRERNTFSPTWGYHGWVEFIGILVVGLCSGPNHP